MKDNLFEILLHLFEASLAQIQKDHLSKEQDGDEALSEDELTQGEDTFLFVQTAKEHSTRIFTNEEQFRLTKASYQFLMRLKLWNIIDDQILESILNEVIYSHSRIITLQETKWIIRTVLEPQLDEKQLAFLDLVLYPKEETLIQH